jgi:hypothetical protein
VHAFLIYVTMKSRVIFLILILVLLISFRSKAGIDTLYEIQSKYRLGKINTKFVIESDSHLVFTSQSEKILFYSKNRGELDTLDIHESIKALLALEVRGGEIKRIVRKPKQDDVYFRYYNLDFDNGNVYLTGVALVEYDTVGVDLPFLFGLTVQVNMDSKKRIVTLHYLPKHERLTAIDNIFLKKEDGAKSHWQYDVRYWDSDDSSCFIIDKTGPKKIANVDLAYANKSTNKYGLVYENVPWSVHYALDKDTSSMLYSNGYELINLSTMQLVYRSDDLYGIASPLFMYKGSPYCLVELVNHKTILTSMEILDRKMLNLKSKTMEPLPEDFTWLYRYIIPKQSKYNIESSLRSLNISSDGRIFVLQYKFE